MSRGVKWSASDEAEARLLHLEPVPVADLVIFRERGVGAPAA